MDNRRYHILILGEDTAEIKRFSIRHRWLRIGVILLITAFTGGLFLAGMWVSEYHRLKCDTAPLLDENSWLQKQNIALRREMESLHGEFRRVTFTFLNWKRDAEERYAELEAKVTHVARLQGGREIREEGIGGSQAEQVRLLFNERDLEAFSSVYSSLHKKIDNLDGVLSKEENELIRRYVFNRGLSFIYPVREGHITSYYGMRWDPITGESYFHNAVDLGNSMGAPVYAAERGRILWSGMAGEYGNLIIIDHGGALSTRYGHLSVCSAKTGDFIEKGSIIGFVGSTGRSTGPHLHFEVRINNETINPLKVLR
ncbi:MAG TPA: peptidoglycan DD-metalloendopeptidase family protein [Candidatus Mcinerneyibacteriales bacterium]|jgi:murein DD-endopeptidase MepM/ murein hydrolase activator NlpD|nr:peptidoglycan DD-metalloendopeptidase family protein [Candidatus Mcinerneyibacteriales bacterium]HPJ70955.1 peptidoglycan DD-metalloendopeptidase family protein [Candidatus Mcinerneyibacteriales bacterium]